MSSIEPERATQNRLVRLFRNRLGYRYLGRLDAQPNTCLREADLRRFLAGRGVDESLADRVLEAVRAQIARAETVRVVAGKEETNLYEANEALYGLLRYGVKLVPAPGELAVTVPLVDWHNPDANDVALAEEVTVAGRTYTKRPDLVVYVNGLALAVIELKKSTVSIEEGIRQNLSNQGPDFIPGFFASVQLVCAGNDTAGLRYGTTGTPESFYLAWKEEGDRPDLDGLSRLDRDVAALFAKDRLLALLHDFVAFDGGIKKLCRPHQYFGITAAMKGLAEGEGGVIWHTQGSGKSLTMVWLARQILEQGGDRRVFIVTDRTDLDEQIEGVFQGVGQSILRTKSGADLVERLNDTTPRLVCSLIQKFGTRRRADEATDEEVDAFVAGMRLPPGFRAKGTITVFVDECHRTQTGKLATAMRALMPGAVFIGFTGTPLLRSDKATTLETFGPFVHTYKFNQAVADKVVLDLRYEARHLTQELRTPAKVDEWFEAKTAGLTPLAKERLKARWATMQQIMSSKDRLDHIAGEVMIDLDTKPQLASGRGNAMLVASSIREACTLWALFRDKGLRECAVVTSYRPDASHINKEETGEGATDAQVQYQRYVEMLGGEDPDAFETRVKQLFVKKPAQMRLLIVVDKLLTGFDAPPAAFLYIDKKMRDHGLFQALCRVNRVHDADKEYGYIVDFKDLFRNVEKAIQDYTGDALDGFDREDIDGLIKDRAAELRTRLDAAHDQMVALCEPLGPAPEMEEYLDFLGLGGFVSGESEEVLAERRAEFYKRASALVRARAEVTEGLEALGYAPELAARLNADAAHYGEVAEYVVQMDPDRRDLKAFEAGMRQLLDRHVRVNGREETLLDDLGLVELIVGRDGSDAALADELASDDRAGGRGVASGIANNIRRYVREHRASNPLHFDSIAARLEALLQEARSDTDAYRKYLAELVRLTREMVRGASGEDAPPEINTPGLRALYANLDRDALLALGVHRAVLVSRREGWHHHPQKEREIQKAIHDVVGDRWKEVFQIVKAQPEYLV